MAVPTRQKRLNLQEEPTFRHLPCEIIADIFSRLTVQDLSRCLFVSKAWCSNCHSLVHDPFFVNLHYSRMKVDPSILVMCVTKGDTNKLYLANLDKNRVCISVKARSCSLKLPSGILNFVGSSNGLVCFALHRKNVMFYICNPLTGNMLKLPRASSFSSAFCRGYHCGFALDVTTNTYKVIRTAENYGDDLVCIEMYNLGSSKWRRLSDVPHSSFLGKPILLNKCLHWINTHVELPSSIFAINLGDESYKAMQKPSSIRGVYKLCLLGGCLSVTDVSDLVCDIWVMEVYGMEKSWKRRHSISLDQLPKSSLPFRLGVVEQMSDGSLLLYCQNRKWFFKCEKEKVNLFLVQGIPNCPDKIDTDIHVGSLIAPASLEIDMGMTSSDRLGCGLDKTSICSNVITEQLCT